LNKNDKKVCLGVALDGELVRIRPVPKQRRFKSCASRLFRESV